MVLRAANIIRKLLLLYYPHICWEGLRKSIKSLSQAKIQTRHLSNTSLKCYCYTIPLSRVMQYLNTDTRPFFYCETCNTSHNFSWILLLFLLTPFWRQNYLVLSCTYLICEGICNCPCSSMVGIMEVNLSVGRKYRKVRWDNFHTKRWRWGIWHCALYLARINRTTSWQQKKLLSGIYT